MSSATFAGPTDRYDHGILGDAIEYQVLVLNTDNRADRGGSRSLLMDPAVRSQQVTVRLPLDRVFEDLVPRLVDMDGDGCREVAVIETRLDKGAQLALYDGTGRKFAATPHIGQPHRGLAPIGAGDLDGDGKVEIAYVDRPHLAKVLRVWRFDGGDLVEVASAKGFSNHQIGWDHIAGGLRDCGNGPEMILASGDWLRVMAVRFDGGLSARSLGDYGADAMAKAMVCQ